VSSDSGSNSGGSRRPGDAQPGSDPAPAGSGHGEASGAGAGREEGSHHNEDLVSRLDALERKLGTTPFAPEEGGNEADRATERTRQRARPPVPERLDRNLRALGQEGRQAYLGAWEAVIALVLGAVGGYYADLLLETRPVGTVIGIVLGFAAMVIRLLRLRPPGD